MIYFTGNRFIDLVRLLQISVDWHKMYNETIDIADNRKQVDEDLPPIQFSQDRIIKDAVPDAEGWINWSGGKCPIPEAKAGECEVRFRNGKTNNIVYARYWQWEHSSNQCDYSIVAYRLVKPDHSQFENSEQDDGHFDAVSMSFRHLGLEYPDVMPRIHKKAKEAIDKVEKELNLLKKDYPVMEGFHKHDCNKWRSIPFGIRVRVQRRDKSFSEGNSAGFNWHENGTDTIIGWKLV